MKFIHISDLHLGKIVNGFSMLSDQKYILKQILKIIDKEKPKAVFIAGDIYDRTIPSSEAVTLLDDFLTQLVAKKCEVFMIPGNHDSAERNAFAARLMDTVGVHISPVYTSNITPHTLTDGSTTTDIYMLPFIKPITVAAVYPDEKDSIHSYTDAMRVALSHLPINSSHRNILITHQFVTGATWAGSEEKSLGGADNIDADVFKMFDYVALGHIHKPQTISPTIRYSGSPFKFSFSEVRGEKSVTIVELTDGKKVDIRTAPLLPLHDMREIKGNFNKLVEKSYYEDLPREDYYRIILTDENDILDALPKLRVIYPNAMVLEYDNSRTRASAETLTHTNIEDLSPIEIFADFYEKQNGRPMDDTSARYMEKQIAKIWEDKTK